MLAPTSEKQSYRDLPKILTSSRQKKEDRRTLPKRPPELKDFLVVQKNEVRSMAILICKDRQDIVCFYCRPKPVDLSSASISENRKVFVFVFNKKTTKDTIVWS